MDLLLQAASEPVPPPPLKWRKRGPDVKEDSGDGHDALSLLSRSASRRSSPKGSVLLTSSSYPPSPFELATSSDKVGAGQRGRSSSLATTNGKSGGNNNDSSDSGTDDDRRRRSADQRRSALVDGVPQPLSLQAPERPLLYEDLINFPRARGKTTARRCVMCGHLASGEGATCSIPLQNKDVCKRCDTGIWRHRSTTEYFKWCKGCKKFLHVCSFAEKLAKCTTKYSKQPSKCDRCRERGRQSYMSKRLEADSATATASGSAATSSSSHAPPSSSSNSGGGSGGAPNALGTVNHHHQTAAAA